jgi:hypothetical protein
LEVFFDNPGNSSNRGIKRERDEDDNVGLSLDGDEGPSPAGSGSTMENNMKSSGAPVPAPLPADGQDKMQRTISQEYLKSMTGSTTFTTFSFNPQPAPPPESAASMPVVHPAFQNSQQGSILTQNGTHENDSVEVPATTKCAICNHTNVDTQFRPCGCLFHGACVKGSIQNAVGGAPSCPIDGQTMISCILAVPENGSSNE